MVVMIVVIGIKLVILVLLNTVIFNYHWEYYSRLYTVHVVHVEVYHMSSGWPQLKTQGIPTESPSQKG